MRVCFQSKLLVDVYAIKTRKSPRKLVFLQDQKRLLRTHDDEIKVGGLLDRKKKAREASYVAFVGNKEKNENK